MSTRLRRWPKPYGARGEMVDLSVDEGPHEASRAKSYPDQGAAVIGEMNPRAMFPGVSRLGQAGKNEAQGQHDYNRAPGNGVRPVQNKGRGWVSMPIHGPKT